MTPAALDPIGAVAGATSPPGIGTPASTPSQSPLAGTYS